MVCMFCCKKYMEKINKNTKNIGKHYRLKLQFRQHGIK